MNSDTSIESRRPKVCLASQNLSPSKSTFPVSMSDVLERDNMFKALKRVRANKGCSGVDGVSVDELPDFLKTEWPAIREQILKGDYSPHPVKTVQIPKPKGGTRMLGIPTVLDRLIQQALLQVLSPYFDREFSDHSYGFRPARSAHQAVAAAHKFQKSGYNYTVDIDLEKFFDQVCHDRLMFKLSCRISDKMILKLVRSFLQAGILDNGLFVKRDKGTPQGSPLSPFLSNVVLDELDKELEARGHKFCRYADDCNIFVKSQAAGNRVLNSISKFIDRKLKLKVNQEKSDVDYSWKRSFLGYSFLGIKKPRIRCSNDTIKRFKDNIRKLTRGHSSHIPIRDRITLLNRYISGWMNYFQLAETLKKFKDLDGWIRSRLRMCLFKQWPKARTRVKMMMKLGLDRDQAIGFGQNKRYWHLAQIQMCRVVMTNTMWEKLGFRGLEWNLERLGKIS